MTGSQTCGVIMYSRCSNFTSFISFVERLELPAVCLYLSKGYSCMPRCTDITIRCQCFQAKLPLLDVGTEKNNVDMLISSDFQCHGNFKEPISFFLPILFHPTCTNYIFITEAITRTLSAVVSFIPNICTQ